MAPAAPVRSAIFREPLLPRLPDLPVEEGGTSRGSRPCAKNFHRARVSPNFRAAFAESVSSRRWYHRRTPVRSFHHAAHKLVLLAHFRAAAHTASAFWCGRSQSSERASSFARSNGRDSCPAPDKPIATRQRHTNVLRARPSFLQKKKRLELETAPSAAAEVNSPRRSRTTTSALVPLPSCHHAFGIPTTRVHVCHRARGEVPYTHPLPREPQTVLTSDRTPNQFERRSPTHQGQPRQPQSGLFEKK